MRLLSCGYPAAGRFHDRPGAEAQFPGSVLLGKIPGNAIEFRLQLPVVQILPQGKIAAGNQGCAAYCQSR